jgi:thiamine biosynthesis lipoprotein
LGRAASLVRARPLLGTLVQISARSDGLDGAELGAAVEGAFAAVARVHGLMSFHDGTSDVSRINRAAQETCVHVHGWTWEVLAAAQMVAEASCGAFDVCSGAWLVRGGFLPGGTNDTPTPGTYRDIELLPNHGVRTRRPVTIDLGGIAKGFAVDRALDALVQAGVDEACVNAGGDLRVFGPRAQAIRVRHPAAPDLLLAPLLLVNCALATSSGGASRRRVDGRSISHFIDMRKRVLVDSECSVSVRAPTCMLADALTKVALLAPEQCAPVLARFSATALRIEADGRVDATEGFFHAA